MQLAHFCGCCLVTNKSSSTPCHDNNGRFGCICIFFYSVRYARVIIWHRLCDIRFEKLHVAVYCLIICSFLVCTANIFQNVSLQMLHMAKRSDYKVLQNVTYIFI